jgi:hypothetical protein
MQTVETVTYAVRCVVYTHAGRIEACNTPEYLGDAYGRDYATFREARTVARGLQSDLASIAELLAPGDVVQYVVGAV